MIDREIKQHFALFLLSYLYSYDPSTYGKREILSSWGFPAVSKNWNFDVREGQMVEVLVFSQAEEVELVCNGQAVARKRVDGVTRSQEMPNAVLFELPYHPGILTAISYKDGQKVSEKISAQRSKCRSDKINCRFCHLLFDKTCQLSYDVLDRNC